MTNLLLNPSFEQPGDGSELQYQWFSGGGLAMPKFDNINPPYHWSAFWREGVPSPGAPEHLTGRPEVKHFSKVIDPLRVHAGQYAAQLFTFWRPHDMGLLQHIRVQAGMAYTASVYTHAWYSRCSTEPHREPLDDDCTTLIEWAWCRLAIGICPNGGTDPYSPDVVWGDGRYIYGEYGSELVVSNVVAQSDRITLFIRSVTSHPLKHNDVYLDDAILVAVGRPDDSGGPRIPYNRTYNLIPQDVTLKRAAEIFVTGWQRGKETAGGSVDDAMLSPLGIGDVNAVLWDIPVEQRNDYTDFRDTYYPDAHIIFEGKVAPEPPSPPTSYKTLLGLHLQTSIPGYLDYIANARPASVKVFQFELAREIKQVSPDTIVVARHHIEHQAPFLDNPNPSHAAQDFLGQFADSLFANEQYIDYVEGLNETIGTHDLDGIRKAVAFESAFAQVLHDSGIDVQACLLNTAVGNPDHGVETELLLPAVEAAMRYSGAIGYHCFSDDTDILTETGWIPLAELVESQLVIPVATLNQKSDELEYQLPTEYFAHDYNGEMLHTIGKVDILVTPNHRMWIRSSWKGKRAKDHKSDFEFVKAMNLPAQFEMRRDLGKYEGNEVEYFELPAYSNEWMSAGQSWKYFKVAHQIPMDAWLQFFGYWITEGSRTKNSVFIHQSPGEIAEKIKKAITACGFEFSFYRYVGKSADQLRIRKSTQLSKYLLRFGKAADKFLPRWILDLSRRQLRILFEAMMDGDGHRSSGSCEGGSYFCTASPQLADDFQELALKLGYATNLSQHCDGYFYVSIAAERKTPQTHKKYTEMIQYDGKVYCVSVPNGLVFVRRNGKPSWQGNSYWWSDPTDDGLQSWWPHHAGRALESWDVTFGNHGLQPHYLLTECGAVGTPDKGYSLMPTEGWRAGECIAGNWLRYRYQLLQFDNALASWNAAHNNRLLGVHIFTSGIGIGWHHFQLADAELISLAEAVNA